MIEQHTVSAVIPALNEELAIAKVIEQLKSQKNRHGQPLIDEIVVCDNGSSDATAAVARGCGAKVVFQPQRGYGIACQAALAQLQCRDLVLFMDGDDSCLASQAIDLLTVLNHNQDIDLVIGSRELGQIEPGALTPPQRFGNWLATRLISLLWQHQATDLGPYRAIRYQALQALQMQDQTFGWTVEMQIKAIQQGLGTAEVSVDSSRRIGQSKISGTVRGVIGAAKGILGTIFSLRWQQYRKKDCCLPRAIVLK